jgi:hypothetical protein
MRVCAEPAAGRAARLRRRERWRRARRSPLTTHRLPRRPPRDRLPDLLSALERPEAAEN